MECTPVRSDSIRFVMPALLRFLFSTGVRIGEALSLRKEDVKLDLRIAVLRDTKTERKDYSRFQNLWKMFCVNISGIVTG